MKEEVKEQLEMILNALKMVNIENGLSMACDIDKESILFFDTEVYLTTGVCEGVGFKMDSLV